MLSMLVKINRRHELLRSLDIDNLIALKPYETSVLRQTARLTPLLQTCVQVMEGPQQTSAWSCFILLAQHPSPNIPTRTRGLPLSWGRSYGSSKTHPMSIHDWHMMLWERLGPKCPCCFDWPPSSEIKRALTERNTYTLQLWNVFKRPKALENKLLLGKLVQAFVSCTYTVTIILGMCARLELYISGLLTVLPSPAIPTRVARWLTWAVMCSLKTCLVSPIHRYCSNLCGIIHCT